MISSIPTKTKDRRGVTEMSQIFTLAAETVISIDVSFTELLRYNVSTALGATVKPNMTFVNKVVKLTFAIATTDTVYVELSGRN